MARAMSAADGTASSRTRGKVVERSPAQGYGFANDGTRPVFVHIQDFAERHTIPRIATWLDLAAVSPPPRSTVY